MKYPFSKNLLALFSFLILVSCASDEDEFYEDDSLYYDNYEDLNDDSDTDSDDSSDDDDSEDDSSDTSSDDSSEGLFYYPNDEVALAEGQITLYKVDGSALTKLVDYNVDEGLLEYQQDTLKHMEIWNQILKITPQSYLSQINQFAIFAGGYDDSFELYETDAYVYPTSADLSTWHYGVAIDNSYFVNFEDFEYGLNGTIVHELGHIITLDHNQIDPFTESENCSTYYLDEGCSKEESYLYSFYQNYWTEIEESSSAEENYDNSPTDFVSEYAATNIAEDMAETLSYYVFSAPPSASTPISNSKILDYYDYPDLVSLRDYIIQNVEVSLFHSSKKTGQSHSKKSCGTSMMMKKNRTKR